MQDVFESFKAQVKEISIYFSFLRRSIEKDVCLISKTNNWERSLSPEIHKILKANLFLILYNLTEAITRKCIVAICDSMIADGISYSTAKPGIQQIFLKYKCKSLIRVNDQNLVRAINDIVDIALQNAVIELDEDSIPISGNLDARKIREIAKAYGFSHEAPKSKNGGSVLRTIKEQRNSLAHGRATFSECGRNYTLQELKDIKEEAIRFLSEILNNVQDYVNSKGYRM